MANDIRSTLDALLSRRLLVLDGAMGTSLQKLKLSADDFGGERFMGCNDYLVLRKPDAVAGVHVYVAVPQSRSSTHVDPS